ncbi:hypothetical protein BKA65DRAFT_415554, partial [Rhexocercosporidium sp. MPI-PUGE-AT-0058]
AKAIYDYLASSDDANEVSFDKNDILEVSNMTGNWWMVKTSNGETGIAPKNFLVALNEQQVA